MVVLGPLIVYFVCVWVLDATYVVYFVPPVTKLAVPGLPIECLWLPTDPVLPWETPVTFLALATNPVAVFDTTSRTIPLAPESIPCKKTFGTFEKERANEIVASPLASVVPLPA